GARLDRAAGPLNPHPHERHTMRNNTLRRGRFAAALLTAGVIAGTLAACGSSGGGSSDAIKAHGPITIWYSNNAQEVQWGKSM
ncbi:hypothetical protein SB717_38030, partial [Priestia sp. SIMBA_032]|uniref:hypothetical protein n=1 Tax=Priestia sp. SIMBA_032 TaxID=3085775 RepID=UPI00397DBC18